VILFRDSRTRNLRKLDQMARKPQPNQRRIENRKAYHNYHILEKMEAGIALTGSEVKSLRAGHAQLTDAFVRIDGSDAVLVAAQIDRYPPATDFNHDPLRKRRLLLHRRELRKLEQEVARTGRTIVPLSMYFNDRGIAKVELGLAVGKKEFDKRQDLKKRDAQREIDRAMKK
jgi:SsrA-binding protein